MVAVSLRLRSRLAFFVLSFANAYRLKDVVFSFFLGHCEKDKNIGFVHLAESESDFVNVGRFVIFNSIDELEKFEGD